MERHAEGDALRCRLLLRVHAPQRCQDAQTVNRTTFSLSLQCHVTPPPSYFGVEWIFECFSELKDLHLFYKHLILIPAV